MHHPPRRALQDFPKTRWVFQWSEQAQTRKRQFRKQERAHRIGTYAMPAPLAYSAKEFYPGPTKGSKHAWRKSGCVQGAGLVAEGYSRERSRSFARAA